MPIFYLMIYCKVVSLEVAESSLAYKPVEGAKLAMLSSFSRAESLYEFVAYEAMSFVGGCYDVKFAVKRFRVGTCAMARLSTL